MKKMSLGRSLEEKRATYKMLTAQSKKWGKVCGIIGALCGVGIMMLFLPGAENVFFGLFGGLFVGACMTASCYFCGHFYYYGFLAVKVFFHDKGIGADTIASAAGTSLLVSYAFGGKKAAKRMGVAWLIILFVAMAFGVYAGLYYYIKFYLEAKKLGFVHSVKEII